MAEHAIVPASKLSAYSLCIGRFEEEEIARQAGAKDEGSQAAKDGTRRHEAMVWRLRNPTSGIWPHGVEVDGETEEITPEDIIALDRAWSALSEKDLLPKSGNDVWLEQRVEIGRAISLLAGEPEWPWKDFVWGTLDLGFARDSELTVLDHKFGHRLIAPVTYQNRAYALGLGLMLDWYGRHQLIARGGTLRIGIVQPTKPDDRVVETTIFPINVLETWAKDIKGVVEQIMLPGQPRTPGEEQCRYCLAKGSCRARLEATGKAVSEMFEVLPDNPPPGVEKVDSIQPHVAEFDSVRHPADTVGLIDRVAEEDMTKPVEQLTPAEIGRILDRAPMIKAFLKDVESRAYGALERGEPEFAEQSGWKLVAGKRKREWKDKLDEEERAKDLRRCGFTVKEMFEKKLLTLPKLDELAKGKSTKNRERFGTLWEFIEGKPVLAPEGDERSPVGASLFEKVPEQVETEPEGEKTKPAVEEEWWK